MTIRPTDLQALAGTDPDRLRWYRSQGWLPKPPLTLQQVHACYCSGMVRFTIPTDCQVREVLMLLFQRLLEPDVPELCDAGRFWLLVCPWSIDGIGPIITTTDGPAPAGDPPVGPSDRPYVFDLAESWATIKRRARDLLDLEV